MFMFDHDRSERTACWYNKTTKKREIYNELCNPPDEEFLSVCMFLSPLTKTKQQRTLNGNWFDWTKQAERYFHVKHKTRLTDFLSLKLVETINFCVQLIRPQIDSLFLFSMHFSVIIISMYLFKYRRHRYRLCRCVNFAIDCNLLCDYLKIVKISLTLF